MEINLNKAFEELDKADILKDVKAFTFKTKMGKGEERRYEKTPRGWLKTWNGEIETNELAVKLVFMMSKKNGTLQIEKDVE